MEVVITDNTDKVLEELKHKMDVALTAIGATAEGHAKDYCPVDTGRLRNSISNMHDEDSAYIGSNVEYAAYVQVELGTSRRKAKPYLKPAVTQHTAEYKELAEQALKS